MVRSDYLDFWCLGILQMKYIWNYYLALSKQIMWNKVPQLAVPLRISFERGGWEFYKPI